MLPNHSIICLIILLSFYPTYLFADKSNASFKEIYSTDKTKLDGIAANANNYSLPIASASALGGFKVGTNLSIDASTGVLSATGGGGSTVDPVVMALALG